MNFKDKETIQKLRGGYYTPINIAEKISKWAIEPGTGTVMEPSCGDGIFLKAMVNLVRTNQIANDFSVEAVELFPSEAEKSRLISNELEKLGIHSEIITTDFFSWFQKLSESKSWDAIIGNPPYIRYQYFDNEQRELSKDIFSRAKVPFTKRTNAWVPFVIASVMKLSRGGRLAMVLPTELLHIIHANGLRLLLEQEMSSINIVDIQEIVFKETLQGVILLLAEKRKDRIFFPLTTDRSPKNQIKLGFDKTKSQIKIINLEKASYIEKINIDDNNQKTTSKNLNGKWTRALLTNKELSVLEEIENKSEINRFFEIAEVDIGIVTGANKYFVVDRKTVNEFHLSDISSPMLARSDFIQGITYKLSDHKENELKGKSVLFLEFPNLPKNKLPKKMKEYIELGESAELHTRYKCRIREPWYKVPYIWTSKIALLKRSHFYPRLVLNLANAYSTDTAYRIKMINMFENREKDFVFSFLNSLTFLSAELEGRHYGGGVLELVPSEIENLLIPLISPTDGQFDQVDEMVRKGVSVDELLDFTDPIILGAENHLNLSDNHIQIIRNARERLQTRRHR